MGVDIADKVTPEILSMFWKVRCTDVSDALDSLGLVGTQVMSPSIRPLWEGPELKMVGIARTLRIVPMRTPIGRLSYEEYDRMLGLDPENIPFGMGMRGQTECLRAFGPDQIWVNESRDCLVGTFGSDITLLGKVKGVRGFVTNDVARDSDEIRRERIPVYARYRSCHHNFGRGMFEASDVPVNCGGVAVVPGDVIIGDNDAVVVVPQAMAAEVVERAIKIRLWDIEQRRKKYEMLGLPLDETVDREKIGI